LATQRRAGLKRAFAALNAYGPDSKELLHTLTGYDGGKAALFKAQHRKCAYCERRIGLAANDLEHVRPKKEVWRHLPGDRTAVVESGYWWLTWTWENHLFACRTCNKHKGTYFPLVSGSRALIGPARPYRNKRLRPAHRDKSVESTLLVDPSSEDPLDHIEWRPVDARLPKRLWKWSPAHLTPRGEATIKILHLAELADDVGDHVRDNMLARTESVCAHVDGGRHAEALVEWQRIGRDLARSRCHLAGPAWNALHHLVDPIRRAKASLPFPPRP
jgi:5-methylcytosine-specific restriction endonuclease McrA